MLAGIEYNAGLYSRVVAGYEEMAQGAVQSVPGVNNLTIAEQYKTSPV